MVLQEIFEGFERKLVEKGGKRRRKTSALLLIICVTSFGVPLPSFGAVKYIKADGGEIVEVGAKNVERTCGKNFVFREINREDVAKYLHQEIVKASLTEKVVNELDILIPKLKSSPGTCSWVTPGEFNSL